MRNIALILQYDPLTIGWQRQKNALSVQEFMEDAIFEITGERVRLLASGRTDAGVHALGQVASFQTETKISSQRIPHALNSKLPNNIVVQKALEVPLTFHPQYDARRKTYLYRIYNSPIPCPRERMYSTHQRSFLQVDSMQAAAQKLVGEHDFSSFCSSGSQSKTKVRTIYQISVQEELWEDISPLEKIYADQADPHSFPPKIITVEVTGNGFLYNMVRIIVGTLMEIGKGKEYDMGKILTGQDRALAGPTAPPEGLYLKNVEYEPLIFGERKEENK